MKPRLIAHADWGLNLEGRWLAVGKVDAAGRYQVDAPEPVGELGTLLRRLRARTTKGPLVVGFDFPIGLPAAYCKLAGITDFPAALIQFGQGKWRDFYNIARQPGEISLYRPFFPYAGGKKGQFLRTQLTRGIGVHSMEHLLRACERATGQRPNASPLFWTLGPKQVGRAAIVGWQHVLAPALQEKSFRVGIWPFHGSLESLLAKCDVVIVETYPAEACVQLGLGAPGTSWSKTSLDGRRSRAPHIKNWARKQQVNLTPKLVPQLDQGFGDSGAADDKFDAVAGLLGMIEVVTGRRDPGNPDTGSVRHLEGWILGQSSHT
jgi:hypothetical protein